VLRTEHQGVGDVTPIKLGPPSVMAASCAVRARDGSVWVLDGSGRSILRGVCRPHDPRPRIFFTAVASSTRCCRTWVPRASRRFADQPPEALKSGGLGSCDSVVRDQTVQAPLAARVVAWQEAEEGPAPATWRGCYGYTSSSRAPRSVTVAGAGGRRCGGSGVGCTRCSGGGGRQRLPARLYCVPDASKGLDPLAVYLAGSAVT
jgi:hypothetical protein